MRWRTATPSHGSPRWCGAWWRNGTKRRATRASSESAMTLFAQRHLRWIGHYDQGQEAVLGGEVRTLRPVRQDVATALDDVVLTAMSSQIGTSSFREAWRMSLSLEDAAKIGGSDLASLLGRSPYGTPFTLYARVVSALEGRAMSHEDSAPKRRGRVLEKAVLDLYAEETGAEVKEHGLRLTHPTLPYGRASLDALSLKANLLRVVDGKTAGLSEVRKWGEAGADQVPEYIIYQMNWYAGIAEARGQTDEDDVDVAALVGGDLRVYTIPWDPELFGMLEQAVERFWVDHVEPRRPPPMTDPLVELPSIGALYPRHNGEAKALDALPTEEQDWIRQYLAAKEAERHAMRLRAEAEARVRMLLGTTPSLALPPALGSGRIDWKQNKPSKATDWERVAFEIAHASNVSPKDYAELVKRHTTTREGTRPLVVRQKEAT